MHDIFVESMSIDVFCHTKIDQPFLGPSAPLASPRGGVAAASTRSFTLQIESILRATGPQNMEGIIISGTKLWMNDKDLQPSRNHTMTSPGFARKWDPIQVSSILMDNLIWL